MSSTENVEGTVRKILANDDSEVWMERSSVFQIYFGSRIDRTC